MIKHNSLAKVLIIFALNMAPVCKIIHAQSANTASSIIESPPYFKQKHFDNGQVAANPAKIKWTWQLPAFVKKAFNNSRYAGWYIARIIRHDSSGKTIYRFYINNGNLLDGDHYDSFLKNDYLDVSDSDAIICNQIPR
jgi:hypothetical protein